MIYKRFAAVLLTAALLFLCACGAGEKETPESPGETVTVSAPEPSVPEPEPEIIPETPPPFSQRAAGLYYAPGDEEYFPVQLRLYEVYGNLYGSIYSPDMGFAALEIFPREDGALSSPTAAEVSVRVMAFSIQSDFGRYWPGPAGYTLRLKEDSVTFAEWDGLGEEAVPSGLEFIADAAYDGDRLDFEPFPYTAEFVEWLAEGNLPKTVPEGVMGLWQRDDDESSFLEIGEGGFLQLYRKVRGLEAQLYRGAYVSRMTDNEGSCAMTYCLSKLGNGSMPVDGTMLYTISGDTLIFIADDNLFPGRSAVTFHRAEPGDVPAAQLPPDAAAPERTEQ